MHIPHLLPVIITLFSSFTLTTLASSAPPPFTVHPDPSLPVIDSAVACKQLNITIPRILANLASEPLTITNVISRVYAEGVNPSTTTLFSSIPQQILQPASNIRGAIKSIGERDVDDVISDMGYGEEDSVQTIKGGLPAFCRFGASITTSSVSNVWFEVWMPLSNNATSGSTTTTSSSTSATSSTIQMSTTSAASLQQFKKTSSTKKVSTKKGNTSTQKSTSTRKSSSSTKKISTSTKKISTSTKKSSTTSHKGTSTTHKSISSTTKKSSTSTSDRKTSSTMSSSRTTSSTKTTSSTSSIPTASSTGGPVVGRASNTRWRGRVVFIGNSGLSGGVNYPEMKQVLTRYHEVAVSTNAGHFSSASLASWAIGNPQSQLDFGVRGVHVASIASQAVVKAFYGIKDRTDSDGDARVGFNTYFKGCSTGGRQGFVEAQRYPYDYDGIMAGAPAIFWNDLNAYQIHVNYLQSKKSSPGYIPLSLYPLIHEQVINQCDMNDGIMDAVVEDPSQCKPKFDQLLCNASNDQNTTVTATVTMTTATMTAAIPTSTDFLSSTDDPSTSNDTTTYTYQQENCLTQPQLDNLANIYTALTFPDGSIIHEPVLYGSEFSWTVNHGVVGIPFAPAPGWFQYQVLNKTGDPSKFDPYTVVEGNFSLIQLGRQNNPGLTNTHNPNLSKFFDRGSKLIHYHGLADQLIPSGASDRFYNAIQEATGAEELSNHYRYFRIPGMAHSRGGDGAYNFGGASQSTDPGSRPLQYNAKFDALLALFAWTESGIAPSYIIGAAYKSNSKEFPFDIGKPDDVRPYSNGVKFTHKMCPYPLQAVLTDSSSPYSSSSQTCQAV